MRLRGPEPEQNGRKADLVRESSEPPTLPIPDFLAPFGIDEAQIWQLIPSFARQAIWIGKETYLGQFIGEDKEEWTKATVERAVLEVCYHQEKGLIRWEPFLVEEKDPRERFENSLLSREGQVYWANLSSTAPKIAEKVVCLSPRVWVATCAWLRSQQTKTQRGSLLEFQEPGAIEGLALDQIANFFSLITDPENAIYYLPELENKTGGQYEDDPMLDGEPEEVLQVWGYRPDIIDEAVGFLARCDFEELGLLRFLTNRSYWREKRGEALAWGAEEGLREIRRLNSSVLKQLAPFFADNQIPPDFLDAQAQLMWPCLSAGLQNRFEAVSRQNMSWLRQGGRGHFRLPEGRPSDSLILLMSGFFFENDVGILQGLDELRWYVAEAIIGKRLRSLEVDGEVACPPGITSEAAEEMSYFALPAGMVLHKLILENLWLREEEITEVQREGVRRKLAEIREMVGDDFSHDNLQRMAFTIQDSRDLKNLCNSSDSDFDAAEGLVIREEIWKRLVGFQEELADALGLGEKLRSGAPVFGVVDFRQEAWVSPRKQAMALRAMLALANEICHPLIGPEDIFVSRPFLLVQSQEGEILGWEMPDGLLVLGFNGQRLDPKARRAEWERVKEFVANFPTTNFFPLPGGVDYCALIEAIKREFRVGSVQTAWVELKGVMGQRLNRTAEGQLRQLRKRELNWAKETSLMTALAWMYRRKEVRLKDIPSTRIVYSRPFGSRVIDFSLHSSHLRDLVFDQGNGLLDAEGRAMVKETVESLQAQLEERDRGARKQSREVLSRTQDMAARILGEERRMRMGEEVREPTRRQLDPFVDLEDKGVFGPPLFSIPTVEKKTKRGKIEQRKVAGTPVPEQALLVDLDKVGPGRIVGEVAFFDPPSQKTTGFTRG